MAWTLCTSGAAVLKAGVNANSDIVTSGSALTLFSDEAEGVLCDMARYDLISNFNSLTANGKQMVTSMCSSLIAQNIVSYDMSSYIDRREAETILDVNQSIISRGEKMLTDQTNKTYLGIKS